MCVEHCSLHIAGKQHQGLRSLSLRMRSTPAGAVRPADALGSYALFWPSVGLGERIALAHSITHQRGRAAPQPFKITLANVIMSLIPTPAFPNHKPNPPPRCQLMGQERAGFSRILLTTFLSTVTYADWAGSGTPTLRWAVAR